VTRTERLQILELITKAMAEKHAGARQAILRRAAHQVADSITAEDTAALNGARAAAGLEPR